MIARCLHIILATVLLLSTTGAVVDAHYCMGKLVDQQLYSNAKNCGMQQTHPQSDGPQFEREPCCEDVTSLYKYDAAQDQLIQAALLAPALLPVRAALSVSVAAVAQPLLAPQSSLYTRPPPLAVSTRLARLQRYSI